MKITLNWPDSIPQTQFSKDFLQGMLNRVAVGYHNYGDAKKSWQSGHGFNWIKSLRLRLTKYRESHNTENLIDIANYAMLEFLYPNDQKAFFKATDKSGSPGAVLVSGRVVQGKEDLD